MCWCRKPADARFTAGRNSSETPILLCADHYLSASNQGISLVYRSETRCYIAEGVPYESRKLKSRSRRCESFTLTGRRCRKGAVAGSFVCVYHGGPLNLRASA